MKRKNTKLVKQSKIFTEQPKLLETQTVGTGISSNSPLWSETRKSDKFWNAKITKPSHPFKGYACSHNVGILISFNSEL